MLRYKIFALGCGLAKPQISLSYKSAPDSPPNFRYIYTHEASSSELLAVARDTAGVFVGRNLDLSTLSFVVPQVVSMPNMTALRFDQCRVDDFLACLRKVDASHRSKITYLTIDNTVMTKAQLLEISTLFSQLETLTLVGVQFDFKAKSSMSFSSHSSLKHIEISTKLLTDIDQKTMISFGEFIAKLFCKVTHIDLTSFPSKSITPLLKGLSILKGKVEILIGQNPIEATLKSIPNFVFKRELSQDLSDWMAGVVTTSTA